MATLSPQNLCDVLTHLRDPQKGVRLSRKTGGGSFVPGETIVNFLIEDISARAIVSKPEVLQLCQALVDRNLIHEDSGEKRFSEQKNYSFNEGAITAFERSAKGPTGTRPTPSRAAPPKPGARRPPPTNLSRVNSAAGPGAVSSLRSAPQRPNSARSAADSGPPQKPVTPGGSRGKPVPPPARRRPPSSRTQTDEPQRPRPPVAAPEKPSGPPPGNVSRVAPPRTFNPKSIVPPKNLPPRSESPKLPSQPPPRPQAAIPPKLAPHPKSIAPPAKAAPPPKTAPHPKSIATPKSAPPPKTAPHPKSIPPPKSAPPPKTAPHPSTVSPKDVKLPRESLPSSESPPKQAAPPVKAAPPPRREVPLNNHPSEDEVPSTRKQSFEKAVPSGKPRAGSGGMLQTSKISPQRTASPERKAQPPPISTGTSKLPLRNLGASRAVLESAKAEPSTVKGQLISAEKNFLIMCSSGLDAYANNNQQITEHDKESLFANLDSIINTHTNALGKLSDDSTTSDLLFNLIPHLHLYLSYIANMSNAFITLSNLRERGVFLDINQKDTLHAQTIEALLERPKQYLADYPAMISNLLERVDPSCEEHNRLSQALFAFEATQRQVETRDLLPKHLTHLWDIEQSFVQSENLQLGHDRELFHEGFATLVETNDTTRTNGERIRILIFRGLVIVAAIANEHSWGSIIKTNLENFVVHDVDKWDNCLEFVCQSKSYTLSFKSKSKWMNYLPVQYPNGRNPLSFKLDI